MSADVESEQSMMASLARRRLAFRMTSALAVTAAVGAGWYLFLRRPSPETVCAHLDDLRDDPEGAILRQWLDFNALYGEEQPPVDSWREHCVWYYTTRRNHESFWEYAKRARCAAGIAEPAHIMRCED
jgi:hypothetical protein